MTESQLLSLPGFTTLPVYDERDERSATITAAHTDGRYRFVRECWTLDEVQDGLKNPRWVPLGALRAGGVDGQVVAYFGEQP